MGVFVLTIILGLIVCAFGEEKTFREAMETKLTTYDKTEPPPARDESTNVKIGVYVNSMEIDTKNMKMGMEIYQRVNWQDKRLAFDKSGIVGHQTEYRYFAWDRLWIPDLFMRNALDVQRLPQETLLKINSTGWLWYVEKKHVWLSCPMSLQKFPMDTQTCPMMFESFGYTMDDLYISWLPHPIDVDRSIYLPGFTLTDTDTYDCSQNYTAGAFPCHEFRFQLRRDIGNELKKMYFPSSLVLILSWLILFVDNTKFGMKLLIGFCMEFLLFGLNVLISPTRLSYFTAADVWTMFCMIFVFGVIVESAIAKYLTTSKDADAQPILTRRLDRLSSIIFPCVFVLFLIIYGSVYSA